MRRRRIGRFGPVPTQALLLRLLRKHLAGPNILRSIQIRGRPNRLHTLRMRIRNKRDPAIGGTNPQLLRTSPSLRTHASNRRPTQNRPNRLRIVNAIVNIVTTITTTTIEIRIQTRLLTQGAHLIRDCAAL